jgi:hypothetical protein
MQARRSQWRFWKDNPTTDILAFVSLGSGAALILVLNHFFLGITLNQMLMFLVLWFSACFAVLASTNAPRRALGCVASCATCFFSLLFYRVSFCVSSSHHPGRDGNVVADFYFFAMIDF